MFIPYYYRSKDATNGAPSITTGNKVRYERGSWPYYQERSDAANGASREPLEASLASCAEQHQDFPNHSFQVPLNSCSTKDCAGSDSAPYPMVLTLPEAKR